MADLDMGKGTEPWKFMRDFFQFQKKFGVPEDTEEYWNALTDAAVYFDRYEDTVSWAIPVVVAFMSQIDKDVRKSGEQKKKAKQQR